MLWGKSTLLHVSVVCSFLSWSSVPLDRCVVMSIWVVSSWGMLAVKLLWMFALKSSCGLVFSFLLGKLGVGLLGRKVSLYLYKKLPNFSKVGVPFCIPAGRVWEVQLFHIRPAVVIAGLFNFSCSRRYLIVVSICTSLILMLLSIFSYIYLPFVYLLWNV